MHSPVPERKLADLATQLRAAKRWLWTLLALAAGNFLLWMFLMQVPSDAGIYVMTGLSFVQVLAGAMTLIRGIGSLHGAPRAPRAGIAAVILGPLTIIVTPMIWTLAVFTVGMAAHGAA